MTYRPNDPRCRQPGNAHRLDRAGAAWPASPSDWPGYTGLARLTGNAAADAACSRRWKRAPDRAAGARRGRRGRHRRDARKPARSRLPGRRRQPRKTLADWRGRTVLLNLWATWCVPCRKEMPALDALQAQARRRRVRGGADQHRHPRSRQAEGLAQGSRRQQLAYYADPSAKVFQDLKAIGKRLRHADDAAGRSERLRIGTIAGPAEWASDDAGQADRGGAARKLRPELPVRRDGG